MTKNDHIKNGSMPVMPIFNEEGFVSGAHSGALNGDGMGLTKREYFAGLAMQALLSATNSDGEWCGVDCTAIQAVKEADALLAELGK